MLFLTGLGDTTRGTESADRRATFQLLPAEPTSFLLWADDERARHTVFNLETVACERAGGARAECRSLVRTIGRVGVEFARSMIDDDGDAPAAFDALVRSRLAAGFEWTASA